MPDENQIGDGPIEDAYREEMQHVGRTINYYLNGHELPEKHGFILLMFAFGDEGRCNYLSNAVRADVVRLLTDQLARFKADAEAAHD